MSEDKLLNCWNAFDAQYPDFFTERHMTEDTLPVLQHYINTVESLNKEGLDEAELLAFICKKGVEKEAERLKIAPAVEEKPEPAIDQVIEQAVVKLKADGVLEDIAKE
ncbi:hypothetical protein E6Q11_06595 [Candidatus Dojkabacteria bacterium]|uniref:Uncharacterized protein n=1 Tax=Candidatus Dojkabacteria bacterium TaxID=2099670 RepID=A0A5C7J5F8_9BACT|nr:MAG: hypothetical protein E6Q11_06595 [Candidatus Dojkabacteria bacterium]